MTELACGVEVGQVLVDTWLHAKNSFLVLFVEVVQVAEYLHGLYDS